MEMDAIAPLVAHFQDQQVFAVGCKAYRLDSELFDGAGKLGCFYKGYWHIFLSYDVLAKSPSQISQPFYSFVVSGGYAAFDAAKLKQLSGFCELFAPFYWEDAELCYRAWKRGWTIHYEPTSVVHHQTSATIGRRFSSREVEVVAERNRLLMHWINLHDPLWLISHLCWLSLKLVAATLSFKLVTWQAFLAALMRLPLVMPLRKRERRSSLRSDREIATLFKRLSNSDGVMVIRSPEDYYQYLALKGQLETAAAAQSQS
jgi:GT2 family glycosyltransferase